MSAQQQKQQWQYQQSATPTCRSKQLSVSFCVGLWALVCVFIWLMWRRETALEKKICIYMKFKALLLSRLINLISQQLNVLIIAYIT